MKTQIIVFSFLLIIISSINNYNLAQVISSDSTNNICEEKSMFLTYILSTVMHLVIKFTQTQILKSDCC